MIKEINGVTLTTDFTHEDIKHSIEKHIEIFDTEFGFTEYFNEMVRDAIGDFENIYNPEKDFMLVSKVDGKFAGTITLLGEENGNARLRYFFVEPFARGKGVGKITFTTAMDLAKEMGYTHLYFSTFNVLKVARTMYRQLGFEITKTLPEEEVGAGVIEEYWEKDI